MATSATQSPSSLLEYLPAIYHDHEHSFIGQFLLAFEKLLLGRDDGVSFPEVGVGFPAKGLEESIADISRYFDPRLIPDEFLPWLASWTAFTLRADLDVTKHRDFIANLIPLYRWRGTKANLQKLLGIFTIGTPTISEGADAELQIGVRSTIGKDTYVGGVLPHFFRVTISLPRAAPAVQDRQMAIAHALIELEKPAHTFYELKPDFPSMRIGHHSTVGVDTLLGTAQEEN